MEFSNEIYKIEGVPAKQESRYTLRAVLLDVEKQRLVATDGHILVIQPVVCHKSDTTGLIPLDAFTEARKALKKRKHITKPVTVAANGDIKIIDEFEGTSVTMKRPTGQFPNYQALFPENKKFAGVIAFDVKNLVRIVQAIRPEGAQQIVELWIPKNPAEAMLVTAPGHEPFGLLMGCHSEHTRQVKAKPGPVAVPAKTEETPEPWVLTWALENEAVQTKRFTCKEDAWAFIRQTWKSELADDIIGGLEGAGEAVIGELLIAIACDIAPSGFTIESPFSAQPISSPAAGEAPTEAEALEVRDINGVPAEVLTAPGVDEVVEPVESSVQDVA